MRAIEKILLVFGLICLGVYGFYTVQAYMHQSELEREFERELYEPDRAASAPTAPPPAATPMPMPMPMPALSEGDLVGRLEIPRINLTVMVMEGVQNKTLRLGAGHIPGTPLPGGGGNSGIAAHRDTFFRGLRDIEEKDVVRLTTTRGTLTYHVASTKIVDPSDVHVLKPTEDETITLVTCFPFYYVGPAPKRFIVHAVRAD